MCVETIFYFLNMISVILSDLINDKSPEEQVFNYSLGQNMTMTGAYFFK